jgi:23S rRNA pseudouridine2457 synthase
MSRFRYFILYKPFGVLSQFTREHPDHKVLGDVYPFPPDVYPVGRLDKDSEGLLLLTNDKTLNHKLLNPNFKHQRTYWVQVEGIPDEAAITSLQKGVDIKVNKKVHRTLPAEVQLLSPPPQLPERTPPIRFRKSVPDSWLSITLVEGKNRQVRKMCAKVGFPVLRLVRISIETLRFQEFEVGMVRQLSRSDIYTKLRIKQR